MKLSDMQQALLVLAAIVLPYVAVWASNGFPTDRMSLGGLTADLITGIILFIKEYLGAAPTPPSQPSSTNIPI